MRICRKKGDDAHEAVKPPRALSVASHFSLYIIIVSQFHSQTLTLHSLFSLSLSKLFTPFFVAMEPWLPQDDFLLKNAIEVLNFHKPYPLAFLLFNFHYSIVCFFWDLKFCEIKMFFFFCFLLAFWLIVLL